MLHKKTGYPEEEEIVMCKVTKIQYNSIFTHLIEYDKPGMIHISEISPGRIRNIRDFVKEGKIIICKVLRVNENLGHIDISLRRVNEAQRKNKVNEIKQEGIAEKIVEYVAKKNKKDTEELYIDISHKISGKYDRIYPCFEAAVLNPAEITECGIDKKLANDIMEVVKLRIKPPTVEIKGTLHLVSYAPNGIEIVKKALKNAKKAGKDAIQVLYVSAGNYKLKITSTDYKTAEKILKECVDSAVKEFDEKEGEAKFTRDSQ